MKHWFNRNYKAIIIAAFLIPIITVAVVSISHVTMWYGLSNPISWAVYLSIGIEIAALSALAAISANMGSKVYFPFIVVTLIQFIGNIFFSYSYIEIDSKTFTDWVDLVSPLLAFIGVEPTDYVSHKRFLALFSGGLLPIISLSFLHMLVKFTEEDRVKEENLLEKEHNKLIDKHIIEDEIKKYMQEQQTISASDLMSEISRVRLSEEDLKILEEALLNPPPPNQNLINAKKKYDEFINNTQNVIPPVVESIVVDKQNEPHVIEDKQEEVVDSLDESGSSNDINIDDNIPTDTYEFVENNNDNLIIEKENNDTQIINQEIEQNVENVVSDDVVLIPDDFIPEPEDLGLFEPIDETQSDIPIIEEKKN